VLPWLLDRNLFREKKFLDAMRTAPEVAMALAGHFTDPLPEVGFAILENQKISLPKADCSPIIIDDVGDGGEQSTGAAPADATPPSEEAAEVPAAPAAAEVPPDVPIAPPDVSMPSAGDGEAGEPEVTRPSGEAPAAPRLRSPILFDGPIKGKEVITRGLPGWCGECYQIYTPPGVVRVDARCNKCEHRPLLFAYEYKLLVSSWRDLECTGCVGICSTCGEDYPREVIKGRTGYRAIHCEICFSSDDRLTLDQYDVTRLCPAILTDQGFPLMLWAEAIESMTPEERIAARFRPLMLRLSPRPRRRSIPSVAP
jgi:hypothetical protein